MYVFEFGFVFDVFGFDFKDGDFIENFVEGDGDFNDVCYLLFLNREWI